jgi:hypothetical protein
MDNKTTTTTAKNNHGIINGRAQPFVGATTGLEQVIPARKL